VVLWLQRLLVETISLAVGLVLAALIAMQALAVAMFDGMDSCVWLCVGVIPTFLCLIAAHEVGHLLAGKAAGLSFARFTVGLLTVERIEGRLLVRLNRLWFQPAAYVVAGLPAGNTSIRRWATMVAGGPLANLLICVFCLIAASIINPGPTDMIPSEARPGWRSVALLMPGNLTTAWLNVAALISLGFGLGTLIPGRAAGLRTDGGQLFDLFCGQGAPNQSMPFFAAPTEDASSPSQP
jgi:hypothetical protein